MTDKELKKLNRRELLELLLEQSEEIDHLQEKLEQAGQQLSNRQIFVNEAGSIAEASLKINGVFEAAQQAAEQYLENIRTMSEKQEEICAKLEADSRRQAEQRLIETEAKCTAMETETREKCAKMTQEAEQKADSAWEAARQKIQQLIEQQAGLRELLGSIAGEIKR